MSDIFKVAGIALAGGVLSLIVKEHKKEYAVLIAIAVCAALLFFAADMLGDLILRFRQISQNAYINSEYINVILKTMGIAYLMEFTAQVLKDAGEGAIASKVELCGKAMILCIAFPVIADFLEVCINAINSL